VSVKVVVASTRSLNFDLIVSPTRLRGRLDLGGAWIGAYCRTLGRSFRTAPSLPAPRAGSRSFVLAPLRCAAGAPP
jgi:hypothetical protein